MELQELPHGFRRDGSDLELSPVGGFLKDCPSDKLSHPLTHPSTREAFKLLLWLDLEIVRSSENKKRKEKKKKKKASH